MQVLLLTLLQVIGKADIMVRRQQQAGAVAFQPLANGGNFFGRDRFAGLQVVKAENHERVGVCEYPLVNRLSESALVNALENRHRMAGYLLCELLEVERGAVEQLQRPG